MAKPEALSITELAQRTKATRKGLYKKIERAVKKGEGYIYINGSGYWSFVKPGKTWMCYLVQSEWTDKKVKNEIKNNISSVIDVIDKKVCADCCEVLGDIKSAVMQG